MASQRNGSGVGAFIGFVGFSVLAGILVTVGVTPAIAVLGVTTTSTIDVFDSLPEYIEIGDLPERNEVLAYQDGQPVHLATVWDQNRQELRLDAMSDHLEHAAVDGEDRRFWEHGGVDASSVVRAAVGSLAGAGLGGSGGASTLTMQLVRNIKMQASLELPTKEEQDAAYLEATEPSPSRKLGEMKLAIGLEKRYSKKEILAAYLNIAYFGDRTYGVQAATQRYYGKDATDLTPAEAASILAIVQWPEQRNLADPSRYEANVQRRDVVLAAMLAQGHLTQAEHDEAVAANPVDYVHLTEPTEGCTAAAGTGSEFFCDYAVRVVKSMEQLGATQDARDSAWRRGGYTIQTTLDLGLNAQQKALLDRYDPNTESRIALGATLDTIEAATGRVLTMAQNRNHNQLPACGSEGADPVSCAPATDTGINYAVDRDQGGGIGFQPGSTYKIFTLLAWIEAGRSVNATVNGTPHTTTRWKQCGDTLITPWAPKNDSTAQKGNFTVAAATAGSVNAAYASMAAQLDLCDIRDVAAKLGVHPAAGGELPANPASILGTTNIAPLTMAAAYAAVANGGVYCAPTVIDGITDRTGAALGGQDRSCTQALDPAVAKTAFTTMQGTVARGTAVGAQTPDRVPLFAKTGTTDNADQIWLAGGSAKAVTVYWQGSTNGKQPNLRHYGSGVGGTYASARAAVWRQAQTAVNASMAG